LPRHGRDVGGGDSDDIENDKNDAVLELVYSLDNVASIQDASSMLPVSGLKLRGPRGSEDSKDYAKDNGVTLKFHQTTRVSAQFSMIFDVQLPPGTTGHLVVKRHDVTQQVYWSLQLVDCFTLQLDYSTGIDSSGISSTATAATAATTGRQVRKTITTTTTVATTTPDAATSSGASSSSSSSISWQTQETMCSNDEKHRIIASVDHMHVTFTVDRETSGPMSLIGTIRDDCEEDNNNDNGNDNDNDTPSSSSVSSSCTLQAGALTLPIGTQGLMPLACVHHKKALL
jgi:hypothetical protein